MASRAHRYWFREVQTTPEQMDREKQGKHRHMAKACESQRNCFERGICGLLGTPWPVAHAPPEAPYGLGARRTLEAYEAFAGVDFGSCQVAQRGRLGGQGPELFAPLWADEQREQMLLTNQLRDVESWAGKGNVAACKVPKDTEDKLQQESLVMSRGSVRGSRVQ